MRLRSINPPNILINLFKRTFFILNFILDFINIHTYYTSYSYMKMTGGFINEYLRFKIGMTGFEPATPCSQGRCATKLRYIPIRTHYCLTDSKRVRRFERPTSTLARLRSTPELHPLYT